MGSPPQNGISKCFTLHKSQSRAIVANAELVDIVLKFQEDRKNVRMAL
jgi:hypothetical protein